MPAPKKLKWIVENQIAYTDLKHGQCFIDAVNLYKVTEGTCWVSEVKCNNTYVYRLIKGKREYLHRLICGFPEGKNIDHINRNGLDNRESNLRACTQKENCINIRHRSKSPGVIFCKKTKKWRARIQLFNLFISRKFDEKYIALDWYQKLFDFRLQASLENVV